MRRKIVIFAAYYLAWVGLFMLEKPLFMLFQRAMLGDVRPLDWILVPLHGLPLDLSVAGYVSVFYGLLLLMSEWCSAQVIRRVADIYTAFMLLVALTAFVADNGLFPYWGFHLDKTLFIYLRTPAEALASGTTGMYAAGLAAVIVLWTAAYGSYKYTLSAALRKTELTATLPLKIGHSLLWLVLTALLFLPIRGSVSVSTVNTGRVYYSTNPMVNSAAINPIFHLVESLSENTIASSRYHYLDSEQIPSLLERTDSAEREVDRKPRLKEVRNIVWLILESFSANAVGGLYGEPQAGITPCIDSLMRESIVFERAYASSFRTDRGVVAVLSAFPGQPTSSVMTIPSKTQHLPYLTTELKKAGYVSHFYYGGDEDFTNMRSYLISGGMIDRVSDKSFPVSQRMSKWGVHDHVVMARMADEIVHRNDTGKHIDIMLTLSSHEPFDVPSSCRSAHPYLNSIAYTDSVVGDLVSRLKRGGKWDETLLVLVADHGYPYPDYIEMYSPERYRILMMLSGGAVVAPERVEQICQQTDLVPTVLGEMGLDHSMFGLSGNIFDRGEPWAFYSYVDGFVLLSENDTCRVDGRTGMREQGNEANEKRAKAYMQYVYETLDNL